MKLLVTSASPYARKCWAAVIELGLGDRVTVEQLAIRMPWQAKPDLERVNPLGQVPVLDTGEDWPILDLRVIVQYLDALAGGGGLIDTGPERWGQVTLDALATGILDAGLVVRFEQVRPEGPPRREMIDTYAGKIARALDFLEAAPPMCARFHTGKLTLMCAIDWLRFRNIVPDPLTGRPGLAAFHAMWAERPCLVATAPV